MPHTFLSASLVASARFSAACEAAKTARAKCGVRRRHFKLYTNPIHEISQIKQEPNQKATIVNGSAMRMYSFASKVSVP